eukprot:GHVP01025273.1.p2 GENE.GHVP01025273.1~~GHVP01025273.1.p2  ORF type:complete len:122 (-),score=15.69 GHVP01025273.1:169-534(-)
MLEVGSTVAFKLSQRGSQAFGHVSGAGKLQPSWSAPCRVTGVQDKTVFASPLYFQGSSVQIPKTKIRVFTEGPTPQQERTLRRLIVPPGSERSSASKPKAIDLRKTTKTNDSLNESLEEDD